jgi:DNA-binding PadR family transcriptional regulator
MHHHIPFFSREGSCGPESWFTGRGLEAWFAGRGGRRHPFGHGGMGGFGKGGFDAGDFPGGRKFSGEDLQLLLMLLLAESPRHGYELIKALEQQSSGAYAPSPGMVYPTLTLLEDMGYAVVEVEGVRKRYSLSEQGRAWLEANRERAELVAARLNLIAKRMDMMRRAMAGESQDDEGGRWTAEFIEARRALKRALHASHHASAEEQQRIADILKRAAQDIAGDGKS